jgi:hypothetical protein
MPRLSDVPQCNALAKIQAHPVMTKSSQVSQAKKSSQ